MSRDQWAGQGHNTSIQVQIDSISFERVEEFKYLGTALTIQNSIQEKFKRRLKSGNACYHSVQNLLSSRLLSNNTKIKIYRATILLDILYGCETLSLTVREEHRLRVFENRVLRRIFGPKRDKITGEWRKLHNEELNDLYSSPSIVWVIRLWKNEIGGACSTHGQAEVYTGFLWGNLKERDHLEGLGIDVRIILRWILRKWDVGAWTGSIWLMTGPGGGFLWMQ